jgi:nucleoside-diphosphate-sugar epimerase
MKRCIITGASGMIGSDIIEEALNKKWEITAVVRPDSENIVNIPKSRNVEIIECDLSNLLSLSSLEKNHDIFFHLGWLGTAFNRRNDPNLQNLNIKYTLDAVNLAHSLKCETFIGAGSQAEYGRCNEKLSSKTPINPETPYGITKYAAGKLSKTLCDKFDIKHLWGRILSVYGPKNAESTLIISCISALLNNQKFSTTYGEQIWDFLYSKDCAKAFLAMEKYGNHGDILAIGSGKCHPLIEYINIIKNIINPEIEIGVGERKYHENEVMHLCSDSLELKKKINFKPNVSFEEGIRETISWVKQLEYS